jgi:hypothetical protein
LRLQDYEPGKDMGMDWYTWRIMHLVDRVNYLTDLLDHHQISLVEFGLSQHPEV